MLSRADSVGVFQVESRAQMSACLPQLQPRCLEDLTVAVAIVRPGPIQGNATHPFLRRRQGLEPVTYPGGAAGRRLLEPILERFAAELPSVPVTVRLSGWQEQPRLLRLGEADAALVYEPFDHTGLDSETLCAEPRVAVLAATHPLAARDRLTLADLGLRPGDLHQFIDRMRREGRDLAQLLTLIALGDLVTLLPASVADRYPRPGVVYRPVTDAPPAILAIAWPQQSRSTATAALVRAAASVAEDLGERIEGAQPVRP